MPLFERIRAAASAGREAFMNPNSAKGELLAKMEVLVPSDHRERYQLLRLYLENTVYKQLGGVLPTLMRESGFRDIRTFESPAIEAVDFHVMHLFPGRLERALPIEVAGENEEILRAAALQILLASNFGKKKRIFSEWLTCFGDVFLKPSRTPDSRTVYLDVRSPEDISDFEEDTLGRIIYARMDVALSSEEQRMFSEIKPELQAWWTEEWSIEDDIHRVWIHTQGPKTALDLLGEPETEETIESLGIEFVPLVRAAFADSGYQRSAGVFERYLEPIDQMNKQATRLRDLYFRYNKATLAFTRNEANKSAARVGENRDERPGVRRDPDEERREAEEQNAIYLPGLVDVKHLTPQLDYASGLAQIEASRESLERNLQELRFFRGHDSGDPSAAAMRQHIAPAISRAAEARGNADAAIAEALKMCIAIAGRSGLYGLSNVGAYSSGALDGIGFAERDIVPETPQEKIARQQAEASMLSQYASVGLLHIGLEQLGYTAEDAKRIASEAERNGVRRTINSAVNG